MNEDLPSEYQFDYSKGQLNCFALSSFEIDTPVNLVALADAVDVLKIFETATEYSLVEEQKR